MAIVAAILATSPDRQARQGRAEENTERGATNNEPPETLWQRTTSDPLALYTGILATSTTAIVIISCVQIFFLIIADKNARVAAQAALTPIKSLESCSSQRNDHGSKLILRYQTHLVISSIEMMDGYPLRLH